MPQILRKQIVTEKDGELTVQLMIDLNINISNNGLVTVTENKTNVEKIEEDNPEWEVPIFAQTPKIKFGKQGE